MISYLNSSMVKGISGEVVKVEVDISKGLPTFNIVGLGDTSIKESKERVRSAIINSSHEFPLGRIVVNLAPADLKKEGSIFDLSIAIGILAASNQIHYEDLSDTMVLGELSLDGRINKVRGILPIICSAKEKGYKNFILPLQNIGEASLVKDVNLYPMKHIKEVIGFIEYKDLMPYKGKKICIQEENNEIDFSDIYGQENAKRALEISAAGGHNLLLYGPCGSGKSMLAKAFKSILPPMSYEEALEVAKIYSILGKLKEDKISFNPPFRSPHHSITGTALIGGGNNLIPGEISLAHKGILFLDELLEFKKNILETLREPLEEKRINITRVKGSYTYPCDFILLSAMNPCPCGNFLSQKECTCTKEERRRYLNKLSAPFLDRIDMYVSVPNLPFNKFKNSNSESSKSIKERVLRAREIQKVRFKDKGIYTNSSITSSILKESCKLKLEDEEFLEIMFQKYSLSGRAYTKILKISRTIADLRGKENIEKQDLIEAFSYRNFLKENAI